MNKHEQLVRQIAEEMAAAQYESSFKQVPGGVSGFMPGIKYDPERPMAKAAIRSIAESLMPAARVAVKHMADSATYAIYETAGNEEVTIEKYLLSEGLKAPEAQEGKK